VVSWVDPDESHRNCGVEDYVETGVLEALEQALKASGADAADFFGFCMGGTLISIASAVLAARGQGDKLGSVTLIGALVDFADMMQWSAFVNEAHVEALDVHIGERGFIAKEELQRLFSMMRANDLVWSSFVNHYLLDEEAPPSDLLFWFEDGSHIPEAFLRTYNRKLLLEDRLREPGAVTMLGEKLDLTKITSPITIIGLKDDHVSSWKSVFRGQQYFGGEVQFILGGSGHNAGVINPPDRKKHGYFTNSTEIDDPDAWLASAAKHEGSWWPHWSHWLYANDPGGTVPARKLGGGKLKVIEPAPGSYVLGS
jgi:polyhydroxyalkanoate synthase